MKPLFLLLLLQLFDSSSATLAQLRGVTSDVSEVKQDVENRRDLASIVSASNQSPTVSPQLRATTPKPVVRTTPQPTRATPKPVGVTSRPVVKVTSRPTLKPTTRPTLKPTIRPTLRPTVKPIIRPTLKPTIRPTIVSPRPVVRLTTKPVQPVRLTPQPTRVTPKPVRPPTRRPTSKGNILTFPPVTLGNGPDAVNTCPTRISSYYQSIAGSTVIPCKKNADCVNWTQDGAGCCLHPYCICGARTTGAVSVKCLTY